MDILLKSVLGGGLIGLVLVITNFFGPKWGGIIAMVPLSFTLSYIFTSLGASSALQADFLKGGIAGWLGFGLFVLTLLCLLSFDISFIARMLIAYVVWFVFVFFASFV